jgi:glycosyltransferase involved in cell wall biosynthesis
MSAKLSIITAIHNQLEYNKLFWESLQKYTQNPFELIIVDNASSDGSGEFFRDKGALVIHNERNQCYSCSQNAGLSKATGEFVAFLNNDIVVSPEWDGLLIRYLELYGLTVISPAGIEDMESAAATRSLMRRWKAINVLQRVRLELGLRYSVDDLKSLIKMMYGDWERFSERRRMRFSHFLYPGLAGYAIVARRSFMDGIGNWNPETTASDFDLRIRVAKACVEQGKPGLPLVAADVFVHHFMRTTTRATRLPYQCTHATRKISELYPREDLQYQRIPAVSLIIAVYQRPEFLEKIFVNLQKQSFTDFEIVVADDGSGPEIRAVIDKFKGHFRYPIQHVWQKNEGFRKTIIANKAVTMSRSAYLVFIDGDVLLHRHFLREHFRRRRVGRGLSGRRVMMNKELTEAITLEDIASRRVEKPAFWLRRCKSGTIKHGFRLPWISTIEAFLKQKKNYSILGSNFSLYKGDYYRVNGYEERIIGRGLEDNNLSNRLAAAGLRIRSIARAAVQYHLYHPSDPVPHSPEVIKEYGHPREAWAREGIAKPKAAPGGQN